MGQNLLKYHIYCLIGTYVFRIIGDFGFLLSSTVLTMIGILLSGLFSIPAFILSIAIIIFVLLKKQSKMFLILPILYFLISVAYLFLVVTTGSFENQTLNLANRGLAIGTAILDLIKLSMCAYGIYLIKNKISSIKEAKKKKEETDSIGVASLVLGLVSFIPLIGLFTGIAAIITGIMARKKSKSKFGLIGLICGFAGIFFTIILYGSLFYFAFVQRGGIYDNLRADLVRQQLPDTVNSIEAYKARYGSYPDKIEELSNISGSAMIYIDQMQMIKFNTNDSYYYYEKKGDNYYLFSKGSDGIPFTKDDIFPEFKTDPGKIGYIKP